MTSNRLKGVIPSMPGLIGSNIRTLRMQAGMTQEELASRLNVTRQAVSGYERGRTDPDIDQLTELAGIFQVDLDTLVRGPLPARGKRKTAVLAWCLLLILTVLFLLAVFLLDDREAARRAAEYAWVYWLKKTVLIPLIIFGIAGCLSFVFLFTGGIKPGARPGLLRAVSVILLVAFLCLIVMNVSFILLAVSAVDASPNWVTDMIVSVNLFCCVFPGLHLLYLLSLLAGLTSGASIAFRRPGR